MEPGGAAQPEASHAGRKAQRPRHDAHGDDPHPLRLHPYRPVPSVRLEAETQEVLPGKCLAFRSAGFHEYVLYS